MSQARVRIVLVRPEAPVNVGAAARALRNAGLDGLDLVSPGDWRTVECWRTAWGAQDVLEEARVFDDLASAVAHATFTAAFSGRATRGGAALDVRAAAAEVATLAEGDVASLVFGPETTGLTLDEISLCGRRVFIPAHPGQPSLNLSHAVMVAAYEVFRATFRARPSSRLASHEEKQRLLDLLAAGLSSIDALPRIDTGRSLREWRALFQRMDLTPKEVRLLEHMARKMTRGRSDG
jgi:TrmH family RNA methyltransferase